MSKLGANDPLRKSVRQWMDGNVLREQLECGHEIAAPGPLPTSGLRRCRGCRTAPVPFKRPPRDEQTMMNAIAEATAFLGEPVAVETLSLPKRGGYVYFLMRQGHVMYVGKSINLLLRLGNHFKNLRGKFTSVRYFVVPVPYLAYAEAVMIRALLPKLNKNIPTEGEIQKLRELAEARVAMRDEIRGRMGVGVPPISTPPNSPSCDISGESEVFS